ncbi:hypothetical protein [Nocardioides sp. YIM 152315]|uniref:hypothetical protein n=1 Tax=Nocardioides sp. YIM 152315 TaxID=3031760 RepID=UPI0023DAF9B6|nr:hypothetical protein [Nocardioides sp. YIM 152315]MDF1605201.1 hypothetical protein [Nocardioides sp. YIM 152315]
MTERLATLLRTAADELDVPTPPAAAVVTRGHRLRRRRQLRTGIAVVAIVAVASVGAGYAVGRVGSDDGAVEPAGPATGRGAVFTLGTTVFYDGGTEHVTIDDKAIKSTYYTSAGLLVRHGENNYSDGGGPQRFSLVTEDGTVQHVSVVTEEVVPGIDPGQPYLAYAEVVKGEVQVVLHDVSADEEVARVSVPDAESWGGWSAPPVALSGDIVYVGTDDVVRTVNWRTGEVGTTDRLAPGFVSVQGGRTVGRDGKQSTVVDVATGEVLLSVPSGRFGYLTLSPDGRFATISAGAGGESVDVYDVDAGTHVTLEGASWDYGWSPDGNLFKVADRHVFTCSTDTGECAVGEMTIPRSGGGVAPDDLRYGNQTYES